MMSCCIKLYLFIICACITITDVRLVLLKSLLKVDCSVTPWSQWSPPNSKVQTRIRRIMRYPQNGGQPCPPLNETRGSTVCVLSPWSPWSANFGFGQQSRTRTVRSGQPGAQCGKLEEVRYTSKVPTVSETASNVKNFFLRPNGQSPTLKSSSFKGGNQTPVLPRDLVLILDSSGSIGVSNFSLAKEQLSKLVGLLCPIPPFDRIVGFPYQYNQAAMLTYSTDVLTNFYFNTHSTTVSIQNAIKSAAYVGGGTNTNKAFDRAKVLFQPGTGVRDDVRAKREVLILTDGKSSNQPLTLAAVAQLKPVAAVYGLMIGTYSKYGMEELTKYVSTPINEHLFYLQNFQQLKDLLTYIEAAKQQAGAYWCAPFII